MFRILEQVYPFSTIRYDILFIVNVVCRCFRKLYIVQKEIVGLKTFEAKNALLENKKSDSNSEIGKMFSLLGCSYHEKSTYQEKYMKFNLDLYFF